MDNREYTLNIYGLELSKCSIFHAVFSCIYIVQCFLLCQISDSTKNSDNIIFYLYNHAFQNVYKVGEVGGHDP